MSLRPGVVTNPESVIFKMLRQLKSFGIPLDKVVFRTDECTGRSMHRAMSIEGTIRGCAFPMGIPFDGIVIPAYYDFGQPPAFIWDKTGGMVERCVVGGRESEMSNWYARYRLLGNVVWIDVPKETNDLMPALREEGYAETLKRFLGCVAPWDAMPVRKHVKLSALKF